MVRSLDGPAKSCWDGTPKHGQAGAIPASLHSLSDREKVMSKASIQTVTVSCNALAEGQELIAKQAEFYLTGVPGFCTVLKREVGRPSIRYLVEYLNGERRWVNGRSVNEGEEI